MTIEELRSKTDLLELFRRTGYPYLSECIGNPKRCPFHDDRRPSFSVRQCGDRFRWKCFSGCGGGDELDYLQKLFNVDIKEAKRKWEELT
jgi:DNA primase